MHRYVARALAIALTITAGLTAPGCIIIFGADSDAAGPLQMYPEATVVHRGLEGDSLGFSVLGLIPIVKPSLARAVGELQSEAQPQQGRPLVWDNVEVKRRWLLIALPAISSVIVRADLVELPPHLHPEHAPPLTDRAQAMDAIIQGASKRWD